MKYKNFHFEKPETHQLVYWLGPTCKEVLGFFMGGTIFIEADGTQRGYYVKYWRPTIEEDASIPTWKPDGSHVAPIKVKRPYNKKSKAE